jgi:hypothetical protein
LFKLVNEDEMFLLPHPCFIWRLAQPIVTTPEPSFKHANMKKYLKRCQWALIPKYPSHIALNAVICWMLFGLRCCS